MKRRDTRSKAGGSALGPRCGAGFPLIGRTGAGPLCQVQGPDGGDEHPVAPALRRDGQDPARVHRQTGIKVETDRLAMARMKDKQLLEMAKPSGRLRPRLLRRDVEGRVRQEEPDPRNWSRIFKNAALADPDYDFKDLVPTYVENIGLVGGPKGYLRRPGRQALRPALRRRDLHPGLPSDLFDKHGLKPPADLRRAREAAARRSRTRPASARSPRAARPATSACTPGCCT